jgi:uncharacterized protein
VSAQSVTSQGVADKSTGQIPVFDIDTHFAEPPDLWTSRAPKKFKDRVFRVVTKADGGQAWFVGEKEIGMIGPSVVDRNMKKHLHAFTIPAFEEMSRASTYAPERLAYMDEAGVQAQIIYPNVIGFGALTLMKIDNDPELRLWHVQAYNDALVDLQRQGKGRLLPQAALPLWDIEASLKELARIRQIGLTGVAMSDSPQNFGRKPLADPEWDRFFATCQDLGLPINFHIGSGDWMGELSKWWHSDRRPVLPNQELNGPIAIFAAVSNFLNNSVTVQNLLLSGILDRYPKLNFVSVESGLGWCPFLLQAMEHNWKELMSDKAKSRFKRDLREMFTDQIYVSYWFENRNCVDPYIAEFGDKNLMFQTDFPHPTSLYPGLRDKVQETLAHHPAETQRKVLYQNAERVYGVSITGSTNH